MSQTTEITDLKNLFELFWASLCSILQKLLMNFQSKQDKIKQNLYFLPFLANITSKTIRQKITTHNHYRPRTREGYVLTRVCPSVCLSTGRGRGVPHLARAGGTLARSSWAVYLRMGYPPARSGWGDTQNGVVPPAGMRYSPGQGWDTNTQDRTADRVLDMPRSLFLLHSRRRTFLFKHKLKKKLTILNHTTWMADAEHENSGFSRQANLTDLSDHYRMKQIQTTRSISGGGRNFSPQNSEAHWHSFSVSDSSVFSVYFPSFSLHLGWHKLLVQFCIPQNSEGD